MKPEPPAEPYTAQFITQLLRSMPRDRLAVSQPYDFQRWPARKIVKAPIIQEMIANEQLSRRAPA